MTSTAFLDQQKGKPFHADGVRLFYNQYFLPNVEQSTIPILAGHVSHAKSMIKEWLDLRIIKTHKVKGSRKKYYKAVQTPF